MNAPTFFKASGASLGLFVSVLSSTAVGGPGPQFWQSLSQSSASADKQVKPTTTAAHLCAGAEVVPETTRKPAWANGRGPLTETQTGTKIVCHICPVTTVVTTNAWPNCRGPSTRTEVAQRGAAHDCSASCATVALR